MKRNLFDLRTEGAERKLHQLEREDAVRDTENCYTADYSRNEIYKCELPTAQDRPYYVRDDVL